jgi:transcription termination/antitermination protein NusG
MSEEIERIQSDATVEEDAVEASEANDVAEEFEEAVEIAASEEAAEEEAQSDLETVGLGDAFANQDTEAEKALKARAAEAFGVEQVVEEEEEVTPEVEEKAVEELFIPDDGREWYVVHCYSGYENKVRHSIEQRIETMNMQDKIFDVVVPTEEEIEIKDGKRRTVERRVFPGYILVQMLMSEDSWYVVRNTPGVTGFVGMGNEPTPLRPDEVSKIMSRMEAEAPKVKFDFQIGEKVRIGTGPFADFIGTVAEIDADRAKVRVMVSFFGRETPVELDFLHVEKV